MNDIQKAIDKAERKIVVPQSMPIRYEYYYVFESPEQLKSLLEQVASDAFYAGILRQQYKNEEPGFHEWWKGQNLTFNEG